MNQVKRNSGATLQATMLKSGTNMRLQGAKMRDYPLVFAPVLNLWNDQYLMPMMGERSPEDELSLRVALGKLSILWTSEPKNLPWQNRWQHHALQVVPLVTKELLTPLGYWATRVLNVTGKIANVVHGDATTENIMVYEGQAVWIDPSTRPMPLEVELDAGKLMQSYFGYGEGKPNPIIPRFIARMGANWDLVGYYLLTHLVRLYKVQPQAREWAVDLANNLGARMKEACDASSDSSSR